jgi:hypothetical protein
MKFTTRTVEGQTKLVINSVEVGSRKDGHQMVAEAVQKGIVTDSRIAVAFRTAISRFFQNQGA